jgi:hypothetical protein
VPKILPGLLWLSVLSVAAAQTDSSATRARLKEFEVVCRKEGNELWGVSLCGRLLLVEPQSRSTVANFRDPAGTFEERDGVYMGTLPADIQLANTSVHWGPDEWAMVLLPLPDDEFTRIRLLAHESFHRVQAGLNLNASDAANGHLDTEAGRLWLRMELRALAQALRLEGNAARGAARDALLFRAARRSLSPEAGKSESALEVQEGLAEYTGTVVALRSTGESMARVARSIEDFEDRTAYSRSFAYATGPALGLLLDRYAGDWRTRLTRDSDLSLVLGSALGFRPGSNLIDRAKLRADSYGFRAVAADEHDRESRRQTLLAEFRAHFIDGPVLQFPRAEELRRAFNPNNLVTFGSYGTVYPTGTFTSRWGKLQIDDVGGLLAPDNQSLRVSAPSDATVRPLIGPGWKLELAPGWTVRPASRAGDFEVAPEK